MPLAVNDMVRHVETKASGLQTITEGRVLRNDMDSPFPAFVGIVTALPLSLALWAVILYFVFGG